MKLDLTPEVYVLAVSGGVDSMVLLSLASKLQHQRGYKFMVAHFEHGIRDDSEVDLHLVHKVALQHNMPFVFDRGNLGAGASEAKAREARYNFLNRVKQISGAHAIVTAHHQDDLIETAILNMLRGTSARGLISLSSKEDIIRPLLGYSKQEIVAYARTNNIEWHEDSTNDDESYRRNFVRKQIVPKLSAEEREKFLDLLNKTAATHKEIDELLPNVAKQELSKSMFVQLPHAVAREVIANWLKTHKITDVSQQKIERLVIAAKTLQVGKTIELDKKWVVVVGKETLALTHKER